MIKIKETVIVEGKYDKIKLSGIVDALIIETSGFGIFKDEEKRAMLKKMAEQNGLLILTDSDSAGFLIRNHIKSFIEEKYIKHVYIEPMQGKERRKTAPSKEGLLGVEGVSQEAIVKALRQAGVTLDREPSEPKQQVTAQDFYEDGLSGKPDSAKRRQALLEHLGLPKYLSAKDLRKVINRSMDYEEYKTLAEFLKRKK